MTLLQNGSYYSAEPSVRIGASDLCSRLVPWIKDGRALNTWLSQANFVTSEGLPPGYAYGIAWVMAIDSGGLYTNLGDTTGIGTAVAVTLAGTTPYAPGTLFMQSLSPGNAGTIPLAADNRAAVLAGTVDGTFTFQQVLQVLGSVNAGKVSGGNTGTPVFRNLGDTANVVSAAVDSNGNRSSVTITNMTTATALAANTTAGVLPSASDNAVAILAGFIDGTYTVAQVLKLIAAVDAGKASGGPGSPVFRNLTDATNVVSGTADSTGNRTSVTLTP